MSKVLMVEDETSLLDIYSEFIESEGHTVLKAVDGEIGLGMARKEDWDVMFLDIMLPKLDGVELLRILRDEDALKGRPVIILTNLDTEQIVGECLELGAVMHMSKSEITPQHILAEVEKYSAEEKQDNVEQGGEEQEGSEQEEKVKVKDAIDEEMEKQVAEALSGDPDEQNS
jgi:DNA-binding response OmpR family regulator